MRRILIGLRHLMSCNDLFRPLLRLLDDMLLFDSEVLLVVVLSLKRAGHLNLAAIVAQIGRSGEVVSEPLLAHILLDAIDDRNYIVDVFFKFFALLQTIHRDEFGLVLDDRVHVALLRIWTGRATAGRAALALLFLP